MKKFELQRQIVKEAFQRTIRAQRISKRKVLTYLAIAILVFVLSYITGLISILSDKVAFSLLVLASLVALFLCEFVYWLFVATFSAGNAKRVVPVVSADGIQRLQDIYVEGKELLDRSEPGVLTNGVNFYPILETKDAKALTEEWGKKVSKLLAEVVPAKRFEFDTMEDGNLSSAPDIFGGRAWSAHKSRLGALRQIILSANAVDRATQDHDAK